MNTKSHDVSRTITVEQAAKELGIGRSLAYQAAREAGHIAGVPVLRVGRRLLISRAALDRVLAGGNQTEAA